MGEVLLGVVEGHLLFQVCSGCHQLAEIKQRDAQCSVGLQEAHWLPFALGECETLLAQLTRRQELPPLPMKCTESHQHLEELRSVPHL
jgi:hypothetical protein